MPVQDAEKRLAAIVQAAPQAGLPDIPADFHRQLNAAWAYKQILADIRDGAVYGEPEELTELIQLEYETALHASKATADIVAQARERARSHLEAGTKFEAEQSSPTKDTDHGL